MSEVPNPEPETDEGDQPDTGDDAAAEAEPAAEPQTIAQAARQDGSADVLKKADRANQAYLRQLEKILGPDENRHECAACSGLGVTWGAPEAEVPPVHPDNLVACDTCNGYGEVITGSRHPQHLTAICIDCAGNGYITQQPQPSHAPTLQAVPAPADQTLQGQYVPGRGFIPYGATEPLPGTLGA